MKDTTYVEFTCNKTEYKRFNPCRPYFVGKDGEIASCHENYREAVKLAPYTGSDSAGKKGGPAMVTGESGLRDLAIENPIPPIEEEPAPSVLTPPSGIKFRWFRDLNLMWKKFGLTDNQPLTFVVQILKS